MKKIVIFLCLIMSLLTVFASCKKGGNSTEPDSDNNDKIVEYSGELAVNTAALKQFDKPSTKTTYSRIKPRERI